MARFFVSNAVLIFLSALRQRVIQNLISVPEVHFIYVTILQIVPEQEMEPAGILAAVLAL